MFQQLMLLHKQSFVYCALIYESKPKEPALCIARQSCCSCRCIFLAEGFIFEVIRRNKWKVLQEWQRVEVFEIYLWTNSHVWIVGIIFNTKASPGFPAVLEVLFFKVIGSGATSSAHISGCCTFRVFLQIFTMPTMLLAMFRPFLHWPHYFYSLAVTYAFPQIL